MLSALLFATDSWILQYKNLLHKKKIHKWAATIVEVNQTEKSQKISTDNSCRSESEPSEKQTDEVTEKEKDINISEMR